METILSESCVVVVEVRRLFEIKVGEMEDCVKEVVGGRE